MWDGAVAVGIRDGGAVRRLARHTPRPDTCAVAVNEARARVHRPKHPVVVGGGGGGGGAHAPEAHLTRSAVRRVRRSVRCGGTCEPERAHAIVAPECAALAREADPDGTEWGAHGVKVGQTRALPARVRVAAKVGARREGRLDKVGAERMQPVAHVLDIALARISSTHGPGAQDGATAAALVAETLSAVAGEQETRGVVTLASHTARQPGRGVALLAVLVVDHAVTAARGGLLVLVRVVLEAVRAHDATFAGPATEVCLQVVLTARGERILVGARRGRLHDEHLPVGRAGPSNGAGAIVLHGQVVASLVRIDLCPSKQIAAPPFCHTAVALARHNGIASTANGGEACVAASGRSETSKTKVDAAEQCSRIVAP